MKTCRKCGGTKTVDEFYRSISYPDGFYSQCKTCWKEFQKKAREENPDRYREYARRRASAIKGTAREPFNHCRNGANKRGIEFRLTYAEFSEFFKKPCSYCGGPTKGGLDRSDNSKGYFVGNVVPCCWPCNAAKGELSREELIARCRMIIEHCSKRG